MPEAEIVQLSERVYYLPGAVNPALALNDEREALLIDTGQDKDAGRALRRACERLGVRPVAILNTHSHADHYGGNDYLLRQFDIPVYAPAFEAAVIRDPYLEPVYLFNGAKPLPELLSKWLLAKPSRVDRVAAAGRLELHGLALELLDTSGHAHRQLSVLVDGVLLAADALFGEMVLRRYPLPFGQDIGKQRSSAAALRNLQARVALPGHGEPSEDLRALVEANLSAFSRAADAVEAACQGESADEVLRRVCGALDIQMTDLPRYYLNRCVVSAYLSHLRETGRVTLALKDNGLEWRRS